MRNIIRNYYRKRPLQPPLEIHKREIALESLEDGVYLRHLSFAYMDRLYDYILNNKTPLHLYYSSALYENPSAQPMEAKGWIGSELIFDIDADKYQGCSESYYICVKDNQVFNAKPDSCESGGKPLEIPLVSWNCIKRALQDAVKLRDILMTDLGFKDVKIFFSGNRGFHVRVSDEAVLALNSEERRLIADYVSCENLDQGRVFPTQKFKREERVVFSNVEYGLRRRVKDEAGKAGILRKDRLRNEEVFTISVDELLQILPSVCVTIDKVVTMDLSRLSRFVGSLNCKSGLKVVEVTDVSKFMDYTYKDLSPFKGKISITPLVDFPGLPIYGNRIDLRRGVKVELDAEDALYVVLKGLAHIYSIKSLEVKA